MGSLVLKQSKLMQSEHPDWHLSPAARVMGLQEAAHRFSNERLKSLRERSNLSRVRQVLKDLVDGGEKVDEELAAPGGDVENHDIEDE
eukprot:12803230-Alexandrium_andersonii.AAC.1